MATIESTVKIILEFDTSSAIASSQSFDTAVINSAEKQKKVINEVKSAKLKAIEAEEKAELKKGRVLLSEEEKIAREKERIRIRVAARNEYLQDNASTVKQKESLALLEKQAGTSRWALINLNRTVSDAPFFFRSFEMGIVSVSNNLDPLIQSFVQAKQDSGSWSAALKGIGAQLMGTGGLMLAFGLVNAAITAFALSQDNAKESTEKQTKAIKEQKEELEDLKNVLNEIVTFEDPSTTLVGKGFELSYEQLGKNIQIIKKQYEEYVAKKKKIEDKAKENLDKTVITTRTPYGTTVTADINRQAIIKNEEAKALKDLYAQYKNIIAIYKEYSDIYNKMTSKKDLLKTLQESGSLTGATKVVEDVKDDTNKAVKEIENSYDSMYADLLAKKLKFVLTEYEYDKWSTEQSRNDAIEKYNEQLKNMELTNEQHYNLLLENENTYRLELLEIDKKYLEKQKEVRAKADKSMRKMSLEELKKEEKEKLRIMREEYDGIAVIADAAAQTMRDSFLDAWKDVFGEANSMLEKFLANVISGIANIGYQYLSESIFGGLMGLFGLGGGASLASIAGAAGRPMIQTTNITVLDGEVIDRRVITNFGNYQTTARNRRLT